MRYLILGIVLLGMPTLFPRFQAWVSLSALRAETGCEDVGHAEMPALPSIYEPRDVELFSKKITSLPESAERSARIFNAAQSFLGYPYVHGVLDRPADEQLVLNLRQLDCWTFVEYSLALGILDKNANFEQFSNVIQQLRYRDGRIEGYGSRLHYFTEWLIQGESLGYFKNITRSLGGIPDQQPVGYISSRPQRYPKVKDPEVRKAIQMGEARINGYTRYFIPKSKVASVEAQLREGDLIVLTSVKKDLDIAHQGFAVKRNGRIHLMHASSLNKKVVISPQPLPAYMAGQKGQSGIIVVRF